MSVVRESDHHPCRPPIEQSPLPRCPIRVVLTAMTGSAGGAGSHDGRRSRVKILPTHCARPRAGFLFRCSRYRGQYRASWQRGSRARRLSRWLCRHFADVPRGIHTGVRRVPIGSVACGASGGTPYAPTAVVTVSRMTQSGALSPSWNAREIRMNTYTFYERPSKGRPSTACAAGIVA